jgi:hypothetical protein
VVPRFARLTDDAYYVPLEALKLGPETGFNSHAQNNVVKAKYPDLAAAGIWSPQFQGVGIAPRERPAKARPESGKAETPAAV